MHESRDNIMSFWESDAKMKSWEVKALNFPAAHPDYYNFFEGDSGVHRVSLCDIDAQFREEDKAVQQMCQKPEMAGLFEFFVPNSYGARYSGIYNKSAWADEGYATFFYTDADIDFFQGNSTSTNKYVRMVEKWIEAVHVSSNRPAVVFMVGELEPFQKLVQKWHPDKFPNLVLLNMRDFPRGSAMANKGKHSHKFRAALFARMERVILMDVDEIVLPVRGKMDRLFSRIGEESNVGYPYPIFQVHWMSKDPRSDPGVKAYHAHDWYCPSNL